MSIQLDFWQLICLAIFGFFTNLGIELSKYVVEKLRKKNGELKKKLRS